MEKASEKEKKVPTDSDGSLMSKIRKLTRIEVPGRQKKSLEYPEEVKKLVEPANSISGPKAENGHVSQPSVPPVYNQKSGKPPAEADSSNDLLRISGIGPSTLQRLKRIGICSIEDLANTSRLELERSFGEYAKLTDVGKWIEQARSLTRVAAV